MEKTKEKIQVSMADSIILMVVIIALIVYCVRGSLNMAVPLFLTWLIQKPELFARVEGLVDERDIVEPLYHQVAQMLFDEYRQTGQVNPAKIINQFASKEEQAEVAGIFHATLAEQDMELRAQEKAFNETLKRIKKMSLEEATKRATESGDMKEFARIIQEQAKWQNMHISIS